MPDKFVPRKDTDFNTWAATFTEYARSHFDALDLNEDAVQEAVALAQTFQTALDRSNAAQNAARSAIAAKDDARVALEKVLRELTREVQGNAIVSDAQRKSLGVTVRDKTPTPVAAPTSSPELIVEIWGRLTHRIRFRDAATPTRRAKPDGVSGCEIWVKVGGDVPKDESEMRYIGRASRSPFAHDFAGESAGKTAFYRARWVSTRGETGAWSQTVSATIAG